MIGGVIRCMPAFYQMGSSYLLSEIVRRSQAGVCGPREPATVVIIIIVVVALSVFSFGCYYLGDSVCFSSVPLLSP